MKQLLILSCAFIFITTLSCSQKSPMVQTSAVSKTSEATESTLLSQPIANSDAKEYVERFATRVLTMAQRRIPRMIWFVQKDLDVLKSYYKLKIVYGLNDANDVITILQLKTGKNQYKYYKMPGYDETKKRSPESSFCPLPYPCSEAEVLEPVE